MTINTASKNSFRNNTATTANALHQKALAAVKKYSLAEADLLEILLVIDTERTYRELGHPSLFDYAVKALGLSESTAYNFITVARKSREVPALMTEIRQGSLSVSKARKVVPVLTHQNQSEWIPKAQSLPQRVLEKEVARVVPKAAAPERATYLSDSLVRLTLSVSEALHLKLTRTRIRDLESQRTHQAATLEAALEEMAEFYLERRDPLERAKRAKSRLEKGASPQAGERVSNSGAVVSNTAEVNSGQSAANPVARQASQPRRTPLPAATRHAVSLRDQARCTHVDPTQGLRCEEKRWLEIHHIKPLSQGGGDEPANLTTLCHAHHRMGHAERNN